MIRSAVHGAGAIAALVFSTLGPCALSTEARAEEPEFLNYEMRKGDTLLEVARSYMLRVEDWPEVQRLNAIRDPRTIPIGTTLSVPRALLQSTPVTLEVGDFSGPVTIEGDQVTRGTRLEAGEQITTRGGGFVTLTTAFGGRVSMPSNSKARLKRAVRNILGDTLFFDFEILSGRGTVFSPELGGKDELLITTPRGVTAVRGTEFRVAFDPAADRSLTEVTEGSVRIASGSDEISTAAGLGVASTADGLSEPEPLLPPPDLIQPGAIQIDETLTFRIAPAPEAVAYRVQIARDAGFLNVIDERVIEGASAVFPGLEDGRYNVRARAISRSGIEGFSEANSFRRRRVGVRGEGGPSALFDGFLFKWRPEGDVEARFAFQLWEVGKRSTPTVDETGLNEKAVVLTDLAPGAYQWRVAAIVPDEGEGLLRVWGPVQRLNVSE